MAVINNKNQNTKLKSTGSGTSLKGVSSATQTNLKKYSGQYQASAAVNAAKAYLDKTVKNKPGAFKSNYTSQMNNLMSQINNRGPFKYDINSDMLYQQAKDQYTALGKQAMQDTVGQAAALTGGYGNSYASTAGNQAYQSYLKQLNDNLPEYYQMAKGTYDDETNALYNRFNLAQNMYNNDYSQYRDRVSDWQTDRNYAADQYDSARNLDYNDWTSLRNYYQNQAAAENSDYWDTTNHNYQIQRDKVSDAQWNKQFDYQKQRDSVSDAQWNQQFNYQKQRDNVADAQWNKEYSTKVSSSGNSGKAKSLTDEQYSKMESYASKGDYDGLDNYINNYLVSQGYISDDEGYQMYKSLVSANDFKNKNAWQNIKNKITSALRIKLTGK